MLHDLDGGVPTQPLNEVSASDVENEFKPQVGMLVVKTMYYPTGAIKFQELRFYTGVPNDNPRDFMFKKILELKDGSTSLIRDSVISGDATSRSKRFQISTGGYITHDLATDLDIDGIVGKLTNEELTNLRHFIERRRPPYSQLNVEEGDRLINAIKKIDPKI